MPALQTAQIDVPEGMIHLGVGQPSLSLLPLPAVRHATEHFLAKGQPELLQYGADQGDGHFRHALARFLGRRYAAPVDGDHLFITAGASQGLDIICTRFTKPGDTIFVEEPTYFLALLTFRDHGLNVVGIPVDQHGLRIDALEDALTRHHPVFLYTIPTFQNPSAVTLPADRRERLLALSEQHDFLVVADEVYHLLDFGTAPPEPLAAASASGRVLSLGSFSKISAPGLRLGWVQTSPALVHRLMGAGMVKSGGGLNPFTSGVMMSMLELGLQDTCLDLLRSAYRERSAALSNALRRYLPTAFFTEPRGGFFIWLELPDNRVAAHVEALAEHHGVSFQPGTKFGSRPALARYVRLSFAHYDAATLVEGARRLAAALTASH